MTRRTPTAVAVWRAWEGPHHAMLGGAALAIVHLWSGPFEVPGRDEVAQAVWPLTPTLIAMACLTGARCAHRTAEQITPRGAWTVRAGYLGSLTVFSGILLLVSGPLADRWVLARNGALLCGLALLAVELLPVQAAWTPIAVLPMVTWLLGSNGIGVEPEPWAVLLEPAGSPTARAVAVGSLAAGATVYLGRPALAAVQRASLRRSSLRWSPLRRSPLRRSSLRRSSRRPSRRPSRPRWSPGRRSRVPTVSGVRSGR